MNERIRELADEAAKYSAIMFLQTGENGNKLFVEKLAELIVWECAKRCEGIAVKNQVEETTYAAGKKAGAFECSADLKEHFGVEE